MNYRIESKEGFLVAGLRKRMHTVDGNENFNGISEMWKDLSDEQASEILSFSNGMIDGLIGVSSNNNGKEFDYYIATTCDNISESNMSMLEVPPSTWAIFEVIGALPNAITECWKRIFSEWFPSSGYENADSPCLEVYSDGDMTSDNYKCALWVPIIKVKS